MQQLHSLYDGALGSLEHQALVFSRMTTEKLLMLLALSAKVANPANCAMEGPILIRQQSQAERDAFVELGLSLLSSDLVDRPSLPLQPNRPERSLLAELAYGSTIQPTSKRIILSVLRCRPVNRRVAHDRMKGEDL